MESDENENLEMMTISKWDISDMTNYRASLII
jgi:hypothetical protein